MFETNWKSLWNKMWWSDLSHFSKDGASDHTIRVRVFCCLLSSDLQRMSEQQETKLIKVCFPVTAYIETLLFLNKRIKVVIRSWIMWLTPLLILYNGGLYDLYLHIFCLDMHFGFSSKHMLDQGRHNSLALISICVPLSFLPYQEA